MDITNNEVDLTKNIHTDTPSVRKIPGNKASTRDLELANDLKNLILENKNTEEPVDNIYKFTEEENIWSEKDRKEYKLRLKTHMTASSDIFLATETHPHREVRIKVLSRNQLLNPDKAEENIKRFKKEAISLASLDHPHIMKILDIIDIPSVGIPAYPTRPGIVLPDYKGPNLKDRIENGDLLSLKEVSPLLEEIGSALDYGHSMGMNHNDVKPTNVLVTNEHGNVLADYGVASMASEHQTMEDSVGTPPYMSPEATHGLKKVDWRSDLYSLAATAYEALTGEYPYGIGEATLSTMVYIADNRNDYNREALKKVGPLPVQLIKFFDKALNRDKTKRFQSGKEMSDAYNKFLENVKLYNDIANLADIKSKRPETIPYEYPPEIPKSKPKNKVLI